MRALLPLALLALAPLASASLERVEPPHWWVGFEREELQILLYGEDLHGLVPSLDHPGVTLDRIVFTPNPRYAFLYLEIAPEAAPGMVEIRLEDTAGGASQVVRYELRARERNPATLRGFGPEDVLYLITPDRFANGDPSNDTVEGLGDPPAREDPYGRHGGDLAGIAQHLDYFEEMGFTALCSNEEYRDLITAAGERGIKVIMDMIVNHSGSEHWFAKDPPTDNWLNFDGEYVNTNHSRTTVQDPHASAYDQRRFADGWFVETMPDLNQRQPLLGDYLIQNTLWWIEESGIAGIRMDTYPYPDPHFMADWTCAVMREYPHFNIVGEEWSVNPAIVAYWQAGKDNHDGYTSCLPSLMDFPLQDALARALTGDESVWDDGWTILYERLASDFLYAAPEDLVVFPDNHDMDRFFTQVDEDLDLFRLGLAYILTTRGVPQIYYGTEVIMENSAAPGDHGTIRTDFPGGWSGDTVNAFSGEGLSADQRAAQSFLRDLLRWRRDEPVVHHGRLVHFTPEDGIYVYFRLHDDEAVMVVLNKNPSPTTLPLARFSECIEGRTAATNALTGDEVDLTDAMLTIPPRAPLILKLR
ncbi:MAG: glycoside hydrolase family 13 protein [Opitutales bacterium]